MNGPVPTWSSYFFEPLVSGGEIRARSSVPTKYMTNGENWL